MKIKFLLYVVSVLLLIWVIFPIIFVMLNQWLGLPVYVFGMFRLIGILLIVAGLVIALFSSLTFMQFGQGTPAIIEPPKKLVIKGLYKRTRNPIYIAHVFIFLGSFVLLGHLTLLLYAVIGALGLHWYVIKHEEPVLLKRFGDDYTKYTKKVPRWI